MFNVTADQALSGRGHYGWGVYGGLGLGCATTRLSVDMGGGSWSVSDTDFALQGMLGGRYMFHNGVSAYAGARYLSTDLNSMDIGVLAFEAGVRIPF